MDYNNNADNERRGGYLCGNYYCMSHVIRKGDTLYRLSREYGVKVSALMMANPFVDIYNLRVGDELCIPRLRSAEQIPDPMPHSFSSYNENDRVVEVEMPMNPNYGMPNRMVNDRSNAMRNTMPNGMPNNMPNAVPNSMPNAMPNSMSNAMPDSMPNGMPNSMSNGMPDSMSNAMQDNMSNSVSENQEMPRCESRDRNEMSWYKIEKDMED